MRFVHVVTYRLKPVKICLPVASIMHQTSSFLARRCAWIWPGCMFTPVRLRLLAFDIGARPRERTIDVRVQFEQLFNRLYRAHRAHKLTGLCIM
jgi:hypothetical protein